MSKKKSKENLTNNSAEDQSPEQRGQESLANFAEEYFRNLPAKQAEVALSENDPELRCMHARSLLAHYEGPLTESLIQTIFEAATSDKSETAHRLVSHNRKGHQQALLETLIKNRADELTEENKDRLIDIYLEQGFDGMMLLPFITEDISGARIDKMIAMRSGSLIRKRIVEQPGERLTKQQINDILDKEINLKQSATERIENSPEWIARHETETRRIQYDKAVALTQGCVAMNEVFSALARHESIFLSPLQIRRLTKHGDALVHLDLISYRGQVIRPQQQVQMLTGSNKPKYLFTNLVNRGVEMPDWKDTLIDAVIENVDPHDWRSYTYEDLDEKHTAYFSAQHIDALIECEKSIDFLFNKVFRYHPEKLLSQHANHLLRDYGSKITDGQMKIIGRHFSAERIDEIMETCRIETTLAFITNYPDKFPTVVEQIDSIFNTCSRIDTDRSRFDRGYLNSEKFVANFGAHLLPERVSELIDKECSHAISLLLRDYGDKVSQEQLEYFLEPYIESRSSLKYTVEVCGRQLLQRMDDLIDRLIDSREGWISITALLSLCPEDLSLQQIDKLMSAKDYDLIIRSLAEHCVPFMPTDRIDKLLDLSTSMGKHNRKFYIDYKKENRRILESIAELGGDRLSSEQITRIIESDRWGTPSTKLLVNQQHRLEPAHLHSIAWKFGYLNTTDSTPETEKSI